MKENLKKIAELNNESAKLIAEEKFDEAITKMQEAETIIKQVTEDAEKVEIEKTTQEENIVKTVKEEIKKRASVNVSNETLSKVFEDLMEATQLVKNVDTIQKIVDTLAENVKKFADTEDATTGNDPEKEEVAKTENSVWEGLGIKR